MCASDATEARLLHPGQDRPLLRASFPDLGHEPDRRLRLVRIGVLGTGVVGTTIAGKLRELGHDVLIGSRSAGDDAVPFADAAAHGELVFNCTNGSASLQALDSAGAENLVGKVLIDVANVARLLARPTAARRRLDRRQPRASRSSATFPEARVVKALNTVNANVMVDPSTVPGEHDVFVCGNDEEAKARVAELLQTFGWPAERILDLGDISAARGTELYLRALAAPDGTGRRRDVQHPRRDRLAPLIFRSSRLRTVRKPCPLRSSPED